MTLENKMISERQGFRIGILENISLGMVVIPYATVNLAGRLHFAAFLIGLILGFIYMCLIYFLSRRFPVGKDNVYNQSGFGRVVCIIYLLRFVLRAGLILFFFGKTVQEFLLQSFNLWGIIIIFALVCGYGASRDIEKRGRMLELLYLWMVIPIILVAVFSISNINVDELYNGLMGVNYEMLHEGASFMDVIKGGYVAFLITTSTELMLFSLPYQREGNWRNALKTGLWILISIFLAYMFIIGIMGGHWVASDSQAALNVMEAAFIPGGVIQRADYPVLAFWVIGVFAIISGYIFYAKEALFTGFKLKNKRQGKYGLWAVLVAVVILAWVWSIEGIAIYFAGYMLWADVAISLILPLILICKEKGGRLSISKGISFMNASKKMVIIIMVIGTAWLVTGCDLDTKDDFKAISNQQSSIENRDYVTNITFKNEEIIFTVADIKKYLSDATGDYETKDESVKNKGLKDALQSYYDSKGRQLDLGHLSGITFQDISWDEIQEFALDMSDNPNLGKSVEVKIVSGEDQEEISLRQLIKIAYSRENYP